MLTVKIIPCDSRNTPQGKLADAELHFGEGTRVFSNDAGVLDGLKLIGFAIWERRAGGGRNVTFPARQYSVNGERRSFALLRPIADPAAQERIRDLILEAYDAYTRDAETATQPGQTAPTPCPAKWTPAYPCTLHAGHAGPHTDRTGFTWRDAHHQDAQTTAPQAFATTTTPAPTPAPQAPQTPQTPRFEF